jgi:hypothetical protein
MELKRENVHVLMKNIYGGNYNRFARELKVDPSHLYRFLTTGVGGGKKLIGSIIKFCKDNKIDFQKYVDL